MKQIISKDKLLESGLQYGHKTESWNPAMKPFIVTVKKDIHMINLDKTLMSLDNAYNIVKKISEKRGTFLFVGTTKQSSKTVRENAERVGAFYIDHRWLGGILTNFRTIQNSVNKLRKLERLEKDNFEGYTKKEAILMKKQLDKLERTLGGIKFMRRVPNAIFVTSIRNEEIAIKEARKMKIPVFGIADTNVDPYDVNFPIFGNDDANKSTSLVTTIIADAIASAKNEEQYAAYVGNEEIRIMGLEPKKEYVPRENKYKKREFNDRDFKKDKEPHATLIVDGFIKEEKKEEIIIEKHSSTIDNTDHHLEEKPVEKKVDQEKIDELKEAIDKEATKTLNEIKEAKEKSQLEKRQKLLSKLMENNNKENTGLFDGINLTEICGVGKKCETYLNENNYFTIEDVSKIKVDELSEDFIKNLPNLVSSSYEDNKEKVVNIVKEAKYILKKHKETIDIENWGDKEISDALLKVEKEAKEKQALEDKEDSLAKKLKEDEIKAKQEAKEKEIQEKKQQEALEEAKRIHKEKELQKKEEARKNILSKLEGNKDLSDIEIIEIYGVGVKLGEYLVKNNLTCVAEVAALNIDNIPDDIIKNLPNLKSATFEDNKEKIVNIIKEAKIVLKLCQENDENVKIIHNKSGLTQEQMRNKLISKLSKNNGNLSKVELIEIYGIGEKVGEYFVENNLITLEDICGIKLDTLSNKFIKEFPNLASATIEDNEEKIKNIIKEAKYVLKKHKEILKELENISTQETSVLLEAEKAKKEKEIHAKNEDLAIKESEKDKKEIKDTSDKKTKQDEKEQKALEDAKKIQEIKQTEKRDKIRNDLLSKLSKNEDVFDIELIKIYGVGVKVGEYLVKNNLTTVGEVASLKIEDADDIIKDFPNMKSATLKDNKEKFLNIIKEAKFLIKESTKGKK